MILGPEARTEIRDAIFAATSPGPGRESLLYKHLCGRNVITTRHDYLEALCQIPDKKSGKIVPLRLNRPQRHVEAVRVRWERASKPVRFANLKARQFGISTYWLGSAIEFVTLGEYMRACILADEEDLAKTLLETGKIIRKRLPYSLPIKYDNRAQLYFSGLINGWIDIETAKADNPCRGKTYRFLHATEPGTWKDPEKKVASVNQSVPNVPGTVLSYEGTANGTGNWWYDFWWDAYNGKNDYHAFFFPWFSDPDFDYCDIVYNAMEEADLLADLDDEEKMLVEKFKLNAGQLKWRRGHIKNNFFGDLDLFHQEFPATPDEAFLASGRPVFAREHVIKVRHGCRDPIWQGDVVIGDIDRNRSDFKLVANPRGMLKVWHHPDPDGSYCLSTDTGEGSEDSDPSVVEGLDKLTMAQVFEFHGRVTPNELGDVACCLGYLYKMAYAMPDAGDGPGSATMQRMVARDYPKIARRPIYGTPGVRVTERWGWDTNKQTKYLMVNECRLQIGLDEPPEINSIELAREMLEYEVQDDGTYSAPSGRHDDRIEAYCVALMTWKDAMVRYIDPPPPKLPKDIDEEHWQDFFDSLDDDEDD